MTIFLVPKIQPEEEQMAINVEEVSMSPRPDVSEEGRNQIPEAAITVFAQQGFDEARMDDVAQEAGLSKGALYLGYTSMDATIAAIMQLLFPRVMSRL